jgi:hypothetical protein
MVEKKEEKKEQSKSEFFESENKKIVLDKSMSIIKGWAIVGLVSLIDYFFIAPQGILLFLLSIIIFLVTFFFVLYFIWAPQDVCWGSFVKEGYTKALVYSGGKRKDFLMGRTGKSYDEEYNVVDADDSSAVYYDISFAGLHINWPWPFTRVYTENMEWKKWYPNLKKALPRMEVLRQFSLLPYPYYVEVLNAEDANRAGVDLFTNVVMEVQNPDKALFKVTTQWIDIVTPLIQGAYVSYIKVRSLDEMLGKKNKDMGTDLLKEMLNPDPSSGHPLLKDMLLAVYGIRVISISIIDLAGSDKKMKEAINAKAIAFLYREAKIVDADAEATSESVKTLGKAIKMVAQTIVESKEDGLEQKKALADAENYLKTMIKEDPEEFQKTYGERFAECMDLIRRDMAIKGGRFVDVRTPDAKGGTSDLMALLTVANMLAPKTERSTDAAFVKKESSSTGKEDGANRESAKEKRKRENKLLKGAGFDLLEENDDE